MDDSILKYANNLKSSHLKLQDAKKLDQQVIPILPEGESTGQLLTQRHNKQDSLAFANYDCYDFQSNGAANKLKEGEGKVLLFVRESEKKPSENMMAMDKYSQNAEQALFQTGKFSIVEVIEDPILDEKITASMKGTVLVRTKQLK